ncbi:PspA/IM30 family protein [Pseudoalteromonas sp. HL-AS2]|uniref:PspA/IM30 family protein n=1 Tax=Pseudoalteromonas TaxID=53246 RepID=UPI0015CA4954|nr:MULTISPECIES: PspA/IM30 family protein [unclassified Pseudoalteromonas]MBB1370161.1 PspA/IM30 family protein [Pseudoalteromonas sp. SR45-4]NYR14023.1 phage shock protein PspA [Pseudoalteromonas sp. MIP2626]WMS94980.1 PspA/IM30 family protein [Pseudoalteromonas sp. HL-AS2]
MGIFNRVTDIVQANIVSILDKAEDPEKLLNLMLSEMQDALTECRITTAALLCEEKTLKRQIENKNNNLVYWQDKAELAIERGRDDLAKSALLEKQTISNTVVAKQLQLETLQQSITKMTADCQRLQQRIAEAKAKQTQLVQRHNIVAARGQINSQLQSEKVAHALSRFEKVEQRVEGIEAQVEAYELTDSENTIAAQIDALVKNEQVDAELARLKADLKTNLKQSA